MEVEFQIPDAQVTGIIRTRTGYCFGVEFLTPLEIDNEAVSSALALFQRRHREYLQEKEQETNRLHGKIAALRHAAQLLAVTKRR
jgi:hypothetical protein